MISNILGASGRAFLAALIAGETDPEKLAALAHPRLQAGRRQLVEALRGRVTPHHRYLLRLHLEQIDSLEKAVRDLEARMGDALAPFRDQIENLKTIPGVSDTVAQVIASEVGLDMTRFPSAGHLISWARLCPKMDESAGKRRSTRVRKGAPWLKTALVNAAWAAVRKKTGLPPCPVPSHQEPSRRHATIARTATWAAITSTSATSRRWPSACSNGSATSATRLK